MDFRPASSQRRSDMRITQYCNFSPQLAKPRLRSIRINGFATCLRLEEIYWRIIEEIARRESLTVGKLISKWAIDIDMTQETVCNFTGFIRIICVTQIIEQRHLIDMKTLDPDAPVNSLQ
jgi:predicted DNA-binding ribbon-helix-helix protein